jgi:uncharacterized protein (DUF934 family)
MQHGAAQQGRTDMKFIDAQHQRWHTIVGEDGPMVTLTPAPYSLLSLLQWHSVRSHWPQGMPLAIALSNTDSVDDLRSELVRIDLITLHFPKWVDGRAYSQAHLLRSRFDFKGELRATGEVLVDMLPLLERTGFDAVELRADQSLEAAQRALSFFPQHYQGDACGQAPVFNRVAS